MTHFADSMAKRIGLFGVLIAAMIALRTYHLTALPFWLDEAYSAFGADQGFRFIWSVLPTYETHPPFYTASLRAWTLVFGNSLTAFRALGVVAAIGTAVVVFAASRRLAQHMGTPWLMVCLPALALYAVLPSFIEAARTVRPYNLMTLANACGLLAVLQIARAADDPREPSWIAWLGYFLCQALLVWLHNLGAFYVAALGLALIIAVGWRTLLVDKWRVFVGGHALVAASAAPALLILYDQAPTWTQSTWLRFDPSQIIDGIAMTFGLPGAFGFLAVIILLASAFLNRTLQQKQILAALLVAAIVPTLLGLILSLLVAPVYLPRTLIASGIPLILLIAAGAGRSRIAGIACMALIILVAIQSIRIIQAGPQEDWYGAVAWLQKRVKPGDQIYAYPNEGALPLRYAMRDRGASFAVRSIPSDIPARDPTGWYPTGSRGVQSLPPARLNEIATDPPSLKTPTIWLLRLKPGLYDRNDAFLNILGSNRTRVDQFKDNDIEIIGMSVPVSQPPRPTR